MVMPVTVEDLAGWDADLRALTGGLGGLFQRPEPRRVFADGAPRPAALHRTRTR